MSASDLAKGYIAPECARSWDWHNRFLAGIDPVALLFASFGIPANTDDAVLGLH